MTYEQAQTGKWLRAERPHFRKEAQLKDLLYYRLPSLEAEWSDTSKLLQEHLNATDHLAVVLGPSGCGKTRTAMELACVRPSVFWVADKGKNGGLAIVQQAFEDVALQVELTKNHAERQVLVNACVDALLATYLVVLLDFTSTSSNWRDWLMVQLHAKDGDDTFRDLYRNFLRCDSIDLLDFVLKQLKEVNKKTNESRLLLVLDEANTLLGLCPELFQSNVQNERRSLFTAVLRAFARLQESLSLVFCGTGIGLKTAPRTLASSIAKPGLQARDFVFSQFELMDDKAWHRYVESVLAQPLSDAAAIESFAILRGRARFTASWLLVHDPEHWQTMLGQYVDRLTSADLDDNEGLTYRLRCYLKNGDQIPRDSVLDARSALDLAKEVLGPSLLFGVDAFHLIPVQKRLEAANLLEWGLVFLHKEKDTANDEPVGRAIGEPLAIRAIVRLLKSRNEALPLTLLDRLTQLEPLASALGFCFEYLVAPALTLYLADSDNWTNDPWSKSKPAWFGAGLRSTLESFSGIVRVENGVQLDKTPLVGRQSIAFPDIYAGPDQAYVVYDERDAPHGVLAQEKFQKSLGPKAQISAAETTLPERMYYKNNRPSERTKAALELWQQQGLSKEQSLSVLFMYPLEPDEDALQAFRQQHPEIFLFVPTPTSCPNFFAPWLKASGITFGNDGSGDSSSVWSLLSRIKTPAADKKVTQKKTQNEPAAKKKPAPKNPAVKKKPATRSPL